MKEKPQVQMFSSARDNWMTVHINLATGKAVVLDSAEKRRAANG